MQFITLLRYSLCTDMQRQDRTNAMTPDEYVGRCKAFVIAEATNLPAADVDWAMHLIDHGEPAEGLTSLAWSFERAHGAVPAEAVDALLELIDDLVPADALPRSLEHASNAMNLQVRATTKTSPATLRYRETSICEGTGALTAKARNPVAVSGDGVLFPHLAALVDNLRARLSSRPGSCEPLGEELR